MTAEPRDPKCDPCEGVVSQTGCAVWTWDDTLKDYVLTDNRCKSPAVPVKPVRQDPPRDAEENWCPPPACTACAAPKS